METRWPRALTTSRGYTGQGSDTHSNTKDPYNILEPCSRWMGRLCKHTAFPTLHFSWSKCELRPPNPTLIPPTFSCFPKASLSRHFCLSPSLSTVSIQHQLGCSCSVQHKDLVVCQQGFFCHVLLLSFFLPVVCEQRGWFYMTGKWANSSVFMT